MQETKLESEKQNRKLSPAVAEHYELEGILPGEVVYKGKTYDFRNMDKETADALHKDGYKRLKPKSGKATKNLAEAGK